MSKIENIRFSYFWKSGNNVFNTTPSKEISFGELVDHIKDKSNKDTLKEERAFITAYGTFSKRNNDSLKEFNQDLIALDYDGLNKEQLNCISQFWEGQPNTILSLISPSQNGLKVIIRAKHNFEPKDLHDGLNHNIDFFTVRGIKADHMQFVLSQPLFIPYSEDPYFNPEAEVIDYGFEPIPIAEIPNPMKVINLSNLSENNLKRINNYFMNRVDYSLNKLRSCSGQKHTSIYSTIKAIYPFINQQKAYTELEVTERLKDIVIQLYGNTSQVRSMHDSIKRGRYPEESLIDLINETAKYKI